MSTIKSEAEMNLYKVGLIASATVEFAPNNTSESEINMKELLSALPNVEKYQPERSVQKNGVHSVTSLLSFEQRFGQGDDGPLSRRVQQYCSFRRRRLQTYRRWLANESSFASPGESRQGRRLRMFRGDVTDDGDTLLFSSNFKLPTPLPQEHSDVISESLSSVSASPGHQCTPMKQVRSSTGIVEVKQPRSLKAERLRYLRETRMLRLKNYYLRI